MTVRINAIDLHEIAPECVKPGEWEVPLQRAMDEFQISANKNRVAAFLSQVGVESGGFNRVRENLYYSTAERIREVWPHRFVRVEDAYPYVRRPEELGNFVYANRMGNGSVQSGDGHRFRGGGLIMTTGRNNYADIQTAFGIPLVAKPELIEQKMVAAKSAGYFWKLHGLNEIADSGSDDDFVRITKIINGGTTGLKDRQERYTKALQILT